MTNVIQNSFSAGELSPTLWGRQDLAKYHVAAATMLNFFVDYRGGASSRSGTRYVNRAKDSSNNVRLLPFKFNSAQQYVLEFSNLALRFYINGGPILEATKAITSITRSNPGNVSTAGAHGYSDGDTVVISGVLGMVEVNGTYLIANTTTTSFQLQDLNGNNFDTSSFGPYSAPSGVVQRVYTVVTPYQADDLPLLKYTQSADTMTLTHPSYKVRNLTRHAQTNWVLAQTQFASSVQAPNAPTVSTSSAGTTAFAYAVTAVDSVTGQESLASGVTINTLCVNIAVTAGTNTITWNPVPTTAFYRIYKTQAAISGSKIPTGAPLGYIGMAFGLQFIDSNIIPDYTTTPPLNQNPFADSPITGVNVTNGGSGYPDAPTVNVTDATGSGAILRAVVVGGSVNAFIIVAGGQNYTSPSITVSGGSGLVCNAQLGPSSGNNPGCSTFFQQRQIYANSDNFPSTLWGSQPGLYNNFNTSIPTVDSDAYQFTIANQQVNAIKSMLAMPGGLVLFTSDGVWQLRGGSTANEAVTPTSAVATPQAYTGASDVPPIAINYDILYVQQKGNVVRDLSYNFFANIYTSEDKSFLSNHLLNQYVINEWTYAEEPFKVIWCVRSDGALLSLTYMREQEVFGWAIHQTQGYVESVCAIEEDAQDSLYMVVKRWIGGQFVKYIERMEPRFGLNGQTNIETAWCLDAALGYQGVAGTTTLSFGSTEGTVLVTAAQAGTFTGSNVNDIIRYQGMKMQITNFVTDSQVQVITLEEQSIPSIPYTNPVIPRPAGPGEWTISRPVTTLTGLTHLIGQTVSIFADGNVKPDQVVTPAGTVTIDVAASYILVGLKYSCQLATLPLDTGSPTIQGYRKSVADVILKVTNTRGLKSGPAWDDMTEVIERIDLQPGESIPGFTGDQFVVLPPAWGDYGQVYFQQDYPLPATVLAVVSDVSVGG